MVYGQPPPLYLPYLVGESSNHCVDRMKQHLLQAQNRMKIQANHRLARWFTVGDWVWLKLHPHKQATLKPRHYQKLANKYSGPFRITASIGPIAYKLALPPSVKIHNVFHVSLLKAFHVTLPTVIQIPDWLQGLAATDSTPLPEEILDKRIHQRQQKVLVKWTNTPV